MERRDDDTYHRGTSISRNLSFVGSNNLLCSALVPLIHAHIPSNRPLGSTDTLCGLIELGRHIEVAYLWFSAVDSIKNDEGVDLKVSKVEVDVNTVEADKEVDEGLFLLRGNVCEESGCDCFAGGEGLVDGNTEDECFGIYITDVDTTFVGEEDRVAFAL